jgi:hypothetical protein
MDQASAVSIPLLTKRGEMLQCIVAAFWQVARQLLGKESVWKRGLNRNENAERRLNAF